MKKILLLLLLIGITGLSYGDSVDDWSDDRLCGWMENPPPHSYMVEEEVKKRSISCSGRVAINNLSDSLDLATNDLIGGVIGVSGGWGQTLDPVIHTKEGFLSNYAIKPEDLSPKLLELAEKLKFETTKKPYTSEDFLAIYGLVPEDLSHMLSKLSWKTQKTTPPCTPDFCFTTQQKIGMNEEGVYGILNKDQLLQSLLFWDPKLLGKDTHTRWESKDKITVENTTMYCDTGGQGRCFNSKTEYEKDKIINKGALINALYRHNTDFRYNLTYAEGYEGEWDKKNYYQRNTEKLADKIYGGYCSEEYGCFQPKVSYTYEPQWIRKTRIEYVPVGETGKSERKVSSYWEKGMGTAWYFDKLFPEEPEPECTLTFSQEFCLNNQSAYTKMNKRGFDSKKKMTPDDWLEENGLTIEDVLSMLKDNPNTYRFAANKKITTPLNVEYNYTDEITNTDQLLRSLLVHDPKYFGRNAEDPYWRDKLVYFEGDKIIVQPLMHMADHCYDRATWDISCTAHVMGPGPTPCIPEKGTLACHGPGMDPSVDPPIRPGWKILEGTDMLVINDEDPYWQTAEGLIERPPKIDPGIEYPPETLPGADPKIVPDLTPEQDKPPSDPNPPPKLDDPSVLKPVDPGIESDPNQPITPDSSDSNLVMTKQEKKQHRIDNETLRRANEGDFSDYVKKELPGAAARLGVTAPKEEDFSQNYEYNQTGYYGDGNMGKSTSTGAINPVDPNCGTPPCDSNPPPKIDPGIEYPPETLPGADPKIVPDLPNS